METDSSGLQPFSDPNAVHTLLQSILESVPDAMIVIDRHGTVLAFSRTAEMLFGYDSTDIVGHKVNKLMTRSDRDNHDQYMQNYHNSGHAQIIGIGRIVEAQKATGEQIPVMLKIGETEIDGEPIFTGYIRDVTEEQIRQHRLAQMQAELENYSRLNAVGSMASAMAHELNQPLTAIANYVEAARDLVADVKLESLSVVEEALDAAASQSIKAGQIVRRLRDYVSRGEIEVQPTSLQTVLDDALMLAKIGRTGLIARIENTIPDDFPLVLADRLQIRQVVFNLLRNAVEALDGHPDPTVKVSATVSADKATVCVTDNGPGLDIETKTSPFDPFTSTKANGMGLGLSICQTIIQAHNGKIWYEPNKPCGARFYFTLDLDNLENAT